MSTDVVIFRTRRVVPRVGMPSRGPAATVAAPRTERETPSAIVEIDPRPGIAEAAAERLAAARARWSQLTFYLFDPASWR